MIRSLFLAVVAVLIQLGTLLAQPRWTAPVVIDSSGDGSDAHIALDHEGNIYATYVRFGGGTNIIVARSSDRGETWAKILLPKSAMYGGPKDIAVDRRGWVWVLWTSEESSDPPAPIFLNLSISVDSGRTFTDLFHSISYSDGSFSQRICVDGDDNVYMLWDDADFKLTRFAHGDTALRIDADLPTSGYGVGSNAVLAVTANYIVHCAWEGFFYDSGYNLHHYVYYSRSIDTGVTFQGKTRADSTESFQTDPSIGVDSSGTIFTSYTSESYSQVPAVQIRVAKSVDGGQNFVSPVVISGADTADSDSRICIDSNQGIDVLWEELKGGAPHHARSSDGGELYVPFAPFPFIGISDFIPSRDGFLYEIGGSAGGVAFTRTNGVLAVRENSNEPIEFSLSQNYPNPFNPTTAIRFAIGKEEQVDLKIYDIMGKEVSTLLSKRMPPGDYSVSWNADHVTSGVYFVRLSAGANRFITKKMILIR